MPYKFNAGRRDKFKQAKYRVTNWPEYNESLRRRGDLTVWFDAGIDEDWFGPKRRTRGGQQHYSDLAIEICLTLRSVFRLALRQTQGLVRSLMFLMKLDLAVPDFSTLSRRAAGLNINKRTRPVEGAVTLIVDSTGLKIHSTGTWHDRKHKPKRSRKTWRKLHIALDADSGDILASELSTEHVGDPTALTDLIRDLDSPVERVIADGAYDGKPVCDLLTKAFGSTVEIIIPPPVNAALGQNHQRDGHIKSIAEHGRMAWQKQAGYNQRSKVEAQIGRWQQVIGPKLHSRKFEVQKTEIQIAKTALNRMTADGRAVFERVA